MALARAGRALLRCSAANPAATCQIQATLAGLYQAEAPLELLQAATDSGTASWLTTARVGLQRLPFRSSAAPLAGVEVEIQSMGESITEGSIAEILKSEGDSVAEDEVIAQIETDKVTIDIKAPVAGKLSELKIKAEDTVKVGQVVAIIAKGEDSDSPAETSRPNKEEQSPSGSSEPAQKKDGDAEHSGESRNEAAGSSEAPRDEQPGRTPSIRFPARLTPDGRRISQLTDEERRGLEPDSSQRQEKPASSEKPQPEATQGKQMPWYVGKEQGTKLSQSRVLSQKEMDQIELGGAEP